MMLYVDPADGRIDMLPHGADETFADHDRPVDYVFGMLGTRCLADPECRWAFGQATWDAVDALEGQRPGGHFGADRRPDPRGGRRRSPSHLPRGGGRRRAGSVASFVRGRGDGLARMPGLPPR
ncbi:MAG: hypothetical protein R3F59_35490 [Myxococcota bacterium]